MKKILGGVLLVSLIVWLIAVSLEDFSAWNIWSIRKELILLTGITAFNYMAFLMLLAVRPKWLENVLGGLDKMYYLHKWAGIWAISLGGMHYLLKLAGGVLVLYFTKPVRTATGFRVESFLGQYRRLAEDLAEWTLWFLLVALLLTLWHRFSYHIWRYTHKLMPLAFLILIFHTVVLSPPSYWLQPVGWLVALGCFIGSFSAVLSLFGLIGIQHTYQSQVIAIKPLSKDITEIICQLRGDWQHRAGQFVFLTHSKWEGAHPFTIASQENKTQQLRLCIKALGNYTGQLQQSISLGDKVTIEGPYGCFDFRAQTTAKQLWIAGGIGITPFIAWLESLQKDPAKDQYQIDLYYCVANKSQAVFATRLKQLVATLAKVNLHLHYSSELGYLTIDQLNLTKDKQGYLPAIWFCGPVSFAKNLKKSLSKQQYPLRLFHQEYFAMR